MENLIKIYSNQKIVFTQKAKARSISKSEIFKLNIIVNKFMPLAFLDVKYCILAYLYTYISCNFYSITTILLKNGYMASKTLSSVFQIKFQ